MPERLRITENGLTPEERREGVAQSQRVRGWSNFQLKIFGYLLIVCSLVSSAVLIPAISNPQHSSTGSLTFVVLLEAASWIALPVYAWLLVDGLAHSRSTGRYLLQLLVLALVSEIPYDLADSGHLLDWSSANPVWALVISLLVLLLLRALQTRQDAAAWLLRLVFVGAAASYIWFFRVGLRLGHVQGGIIILAFALVFYFLRGRENTMVLAALLPGLLGFGPPIIGLIAIHVRNGRLGYRRPWVKWVFYALYPVTLLAFGLVRVLAVA